MEEKIIKVAKMVMADTEAYCIKMDINSADEAKLWRSAYDEIEGIIILAMELLDCEIEDYPISRLQKMQDMIREKIEQ